jgi:uncharacterized damage-inducible protein DinB
MVLGLREEATMDEGPVVRTKQELIDHTCAVWDDFVTYVDGLTAEQWTEPRDEAGWSVKDHVSHVTQWDRAVIRRLRDNVPMEETLEISAGAWADESLDPMNEEVRRLAAADAVDRVCADRDATWIEVVSLLEDLSEEQLARSAADAGLAVGTGPLAGSVLTVLASYWGDHYREHLQVIKAIVADESEPATE